MRQPAASPSVLTATAAAAIAYDHSCVADNVADRLALGETGVRRSIPSPDLTRPRSGRPLGGVLPIVGVIFGLGLAAGAILRPPVTKSKLWRIGVIGQ